MAKVILIIAGLVLLGFGIACLIKPISVLSNLGLPLADDAVLRTELRAFYGGLEIALGAILIYCAFHPELTRHGLFLSMFIYGSVAAGRTLGILVDGSATRVMLAAAAFEWILAAICLFAIFQDNKE